MAGKKLTAPSQIYLVLSGHYQGIESTIQGAYVDHDAAVLASNNDVGLMHVVPVNYNGVYVSPIHDHSQQRH
jgi:hypothetical protein